MRWIPKDISSMFGVRKRVHRLQFSANCLMMSSVVTTQYTSVTDGQTDRHRTTYIPRYAYAYTSRGKMAELAFVLKQQLVFFLLLQVLLADVQRIGICAILSICNAFIKAFFFFSIKTLLFFSNVYQTTVRFKSHHNKQLAYLTLQVRVQRYTTADATILSVAGLNSLQDRRHNLPFLSFSFGVRVSLTHQR